MARLQQKGTAARHGPLTCQIRNSWMHEHRRGASKVGGCPHITGCRRVWPALPPSLSLPVLRPYWVGACLLWVGACLLLLCVGACLVSFAWFTHPTPPTEQHPAPTQSHSTPTHSPSQHHRVLCLHAAHACYCVPTQTEIREHQKFQSERGSGAPPRRRAGHRDGKAPYRAKQMQIPTKRRREGEHGRDTTGPPPEARVCPS